MTNLAEYYRGAEAAAAALAAETLAPAIAATAVHAAMAPLFAATTDHDQLACRNGCDHCCHYPVGVTPGEAELLASAIAADTLLVARVQAAATATASSRQEQLVGEPCPLLVEHRCAVHAARPLPCRALGSRDANACAAALTGPAIVPRDEAAYWRGLGASAALADAHGPVRELRQALAAALRQRLPP
jgi:Fe-S-cluster containining protein